MIQNSNRLKLMAECRITRTQMFASANCTVVVLGDTEKTDVWI